MRVLECHQSFHLSLHPPFRHAFETANSRSISLLSRFHENREKQEEEP